MSLDDKSYFAKPEEILARKNSLFSQNETFADEVKCFSLYLKKKKLDSNPNATYEDRNGVNVIDDFMRTARKAISFDHEDTSKNNMLNWAIIYGKAYERISVLAKNQKDKEQIKLVIEDISDLIKNVRKFNPLSNDILDFYIARIDTFAKTVNPDTLWYSKGIMVD